MTQHLPSLNSAVYSGTKAAVDAIITAGLNEDMRAGIEAVTPMARRG
ncbi:hypothetical protein [Legionella sp. PATHC039]|nr:hypothetical protein [Legionella sp. PATHC039]MCW8394325.1 hypothetical protein [Legionella sp. PATHC039]